MCVHLPAVEALLPDYAEDYWFRVSENKRYARPPTPRCFAVKKGLSFACAGGDSDDTLWRRSEDVTVRGKPAQGRAEHVDL